MPIRKSALLSTVLALTALGAAASAHAGDDNLIGGRVGLYTHRDQPYLGVEFVVGIGSRYSFNPNVEYMRFGDTQEVTLNADFTADFPIRGRLRGWGGAGLGIVSTHPDGPGEPDTKDGLANLFLGIGFETGIGIPYVTAKYVTKRDPQFLLGVGMRF
jgi:hypothetical protein